MTKDTELSIIVVTYNSAGQIKDLLDERTRVEDEITNRSTGTGEHEAQQMEVAARIQKILVENTKVEAEVEMLQREYKKYEGTPILKKKPTELERGISTLERRLEEFGSINLKAIESYDETKKEYDEITGKLDTLKTERQSIFDFMEQVEQKKHATFMETFEEVKKHFEDIFARLSDGQGTLILDNPRNISESGLLIRASPKAKKIMSLEAMSGGEKVLTTAAFLLALQQYRPSFFYIVDELDAALDRENSIRLAEMLRDGEAQFVMVTHNNTMVKYAGSVIGVSMSEGVSQVVGVKMPDEKAAA